MLTAVVIGRVALQCLRRPLHMDCRQSSSLSLTSANDPVFIVQLLCDTEEASLSGLTTHRAAAGPSRRQIWNPAV